MKTGESSDYGPFQSVDDFKSRRPLKDKDISDYNISGCSEE